jgi:hypothetical protein
MTTARTIIKKAMQKSGILTKGENPSADEANDALDTLNDLLSSWSNDSLLVYVRSLEQFTLAAGTANYTIGPSMTFNTARPLQIASGYVRSGSTDYPLNKLQDVVFDESITDKSSPGIPDTFVYDNNSPTGIITFHPVPSENYPVYLRMEKLLTQFALDDDLTFPPGWERALIYNLAIELAPEYGQDVGQVVFTIAQESIGKIKEAVARNRTMDTPPLTGGTIFNIYSGQLQ